MDNTKLTVSVRDTNNNSDTINISYVNPDADDSVLRQFAQKINGLTTNTLVSVSKSVVTDITGDIEPSGVTFNLNLDLFAQNPDFIKQGIDWTFAELSRLSPSSDIWVNSAVVNADDDTVTLTGNYLYSNNVNSNTVTQNADLLVFSININNTDIEYTLGEWINFTSDTLIADLNNKLSDTTVSYSNGKLTFYNPEKLSIKNNSLENTVIPRQLSNYIGAKFYNTDLPDGVTIEYFAQTYTVTINITDTGVVTLGDTVTDISPSYSLTSADDKIALFNSSVMPKFVQIWGNDSTVTVSDIPQTYIQGLAYYGSSGTYGDTDTWIVKPIQFSSGNGKVLLSAGSLGLTTEQWANIYWAFIVKFDGDTPICTTNIGPGESMIKRLEVSGVGNSTVLIYLVPKVG